MLSYTFIFSILFVTAAYFYATIVLFEAEDYNEELQNVIDAWQSAITKPQSQFTNIVVGVNACVDLIVEGTTLLKVLGIKPGDRKDHATVSSMDELQEVFHHHFALGAAAERFFADGGTFKIVTDTGAQLDGASWYIGGNAALIAQKMADTFPEVKVQLAGPVGPRLRSLLHENIVVPTASMQDSDEVHLIMQYNAGDRWAETVTPTATRFITSHDMANAQITSLEVFLDTIQKTSPELVVFSGLHMLEGQPRDMWSPRIEAMASGVSEIPRGIPIHMELASMVNEDLMLDIVRKVLPTVDSLGLNEQELYFICEVTDCPHKDVFDGEGRPKPHKVTSILTWILQEMHLGKSSRLSRIHFHSLSFHVLATSSSVWQNTMSSVAAGARIASFQACDNEFLDDSSTELRMPSQYRLLEDGEEIIFNASEPLNRALNGGIEFIFSPVLVCKHPSKTVGLGDAISAMGLMYSSFMEVNSSGEK